MSQKGQAPLPAEHGSFLQPSSVSGSTVNFVQTSSFNGGTITLNATGDASNLDFVTITVNFDYIINGNIYPWNSIVAWNYSNLLVDFTAGFQDNYLYRVGSTVSGSTAANRKTMLIDIFSQDLNVSVLTANGDSHRKIFYCKNNDTSTHTITIWTGWKYIVTGGPNG